MQRARVKRRRRQPGSSPSPLSSADETRGHREDADAARSHLKASLKRLKEDLFVHGAKNELWEKCVDAAKKKLAEENRTKFRGRCSALCTKGFKGLTLLLLLLLFAALFLYLCRPASFILQRKFHSSLYPISRYARKVLLVLHPYLHTAGINIFSACILSNPFIRNKCVGPEDMWVYMHVCTSEVSPLTPSSLTLSEEWFSGGKVLPADILEGSRNGQWWIVKSAVMVTKEVTFMDLYKFSVDNAGNIPNICEQIVSGGEGSEVTAFYTDMFDPWKMKEALKSPIPWSLSWVECPEMSNRLSIRSLFPSFSFLPPVISTSNNALISLSTEWCITFHYQTGLPSTLLSLVVAKGEVKIIPVVLDESCHHITNRLWHKSILLKEGDAVLLDHQYWSYEVETWSNYSITITSSLTPSNDTIA